jgi:NAD(P)-dependent dehydrogenase (short-subunit alcohol dehydrogenase family)
MKVALVTGASSGIGKAIADRLLEAGYSVAVSGRSIAKLREAYANVAPARIHFIEADASVTDSYTKVVSETVNAFGRLDALVNNVGGGTLGRTLAATTVDAFYSAFQLNTASVFFTTQAALPYLKEARGVVVNFSSILASRPVAGLGPYSAAKAAVEMLTKTAALELAPFGVRVMCVSPATIQTGFHTAAGMSEAAAAAYYDSSKTTHPLGRIGQPDDISGLVAFLLDENQAGFMTGSVIHVDGGRLLTSATATGLQR